MSEKLTSFFCHSHILETRVTLNRISRLNKNATMVYYEPDDGENKVCQHIVGPEKIHLDQTQDAKQVILKNILIRTDVWCCKSRCLHDPFFCRAIKDYTLKR